MYEMKLMYTKCGVYLCSSIGLNLYICWKKDESNQISGIHTSSLRYARMLNKLLSIVIFSGWAYLVKTCTKLLTLTTMRFASRFRVTPAEDGKYIAYHAEDGKYIHECPLLCRLLLHSRMVSSCVYQSNIPDS